MKKIIAMLLAVLTVLSLVPFALADGEEVDESWVGEVISMQVSLYNGPNGSSGSSRKVKNGQEFYIQEKRDNWVYVAVPDEKIEGEYDFGWIMLYYIIENPTHIVLRDASGVYAYAAPYNTEKRVGTVSDYDRFTVIATTGDYYIVSFRNAVCYLPMSADYWIEEDLEAIVEGPAVQYTVKANDTRVYGYASTKYGHIDTYKKGKVVDVLYIQDDYAAIRYENVIAFIEMEKLEAI
ncbi:MAG: hypothetical protein IJA59_02590 [Clostridia bacterium]|nr:hypothetical protein [Clostridia bacterium]